MRQRGRIGGTWAAAFVCAALLAAGRKASGNDHSLRFDPNAGVVWAAPVGTVWLDGGERAAGPVVRFGTRGDERRLTGPTVRCVGPQRLRLAYRLAGPGGATVEVTRDIAVGNAGLHETFALTPSKPLAMDVEIVRPFALRLAAGAAEQAGLPLKNGWARTLPLGDRSVEGEYRLGSALTGGQVAELALPMVQVNRPGKWTAAVCADPTFACLFGLRRVGGEVRGSLRYRYAGSRVPLANAETRTFGVWLGRAADGEQPFAAALDAFFRLMLPDVPPGPAWLHEIAMVGYDYLSDGGRGWDRDVRALAEWLAPAERRRVALCLHGWYDAIGSYCYDDASGRMKTEWLAFGPSQKIRMTDKELRRRLRLARELGFRVLLYFADGLAADSGAPGYRDKWAYRDAKGNRIRGWQGPDTFGATYWLNPAHPDVRAWFLGYLDALLKAYGADVDGLVWDETFECRTGQVAAAPAPAYCDRAMMSLVKELTRRVHALDARKAFLTSDCLGVTGAVPPYALMADGTYQDTACRPAAWSYGLLPNWRNVLWSCNWESISRFHEMNWGVETFGTPVAISNGWGNGCGPAEWSPGQRDAFLKLFRRRLARKRPLRLLTRDPRELLRTVYPPADAGDPLPAPAPGEANWALAKRGGRATASSQYADGAATYPPAGVIDGVRGDAGWGRGHGWASAAGKPLPQWLEVDFGRTRAVSRFVVITYHRPGTADTAGRWGVKDFRIEVWDANARAWRTAATDARGRVAVVRVHRLAKPVRTNRFRVVVTRVAPADGIARLLQVEAWGPGAPR